MQESIIVYYIPQNINIIGERIYNFYLNKATNLDLTSIIEDNKQTLNGMITPNTKALSSPKQKTLISEEYYNNILSLAQTATNLYNQSQELVKKLSKGRGH